MAAMLVKRRFMCCKKMILLCALLIYGVSSLPVNNGNDKIDSEDLAMLRSIDDESGIEVTGISSKATAPTVNDEQQMLEKILKQFDSTQLHLKQLEPDNAQTETTSNAIPLIALNSQVPNLLNQNNAFGLPVHQVMLALPQMSESEIPIVPPLPPPPPLGTVASSMGQEVGLQHFEPVRQFATDNEVLASREDEAAFDLNRIITGDPMKTPLDDLNTAANQYYGTPYYPYYYYYGGVYYIPIYYSNNYYSNSNRRQYNTAGGYYGNYQRPLNSGYYGYGYRKPQTSTSVENIPWP